MIIVQLLSVKDTASMLGLSESTVRKMEYDGKLHRVSNFPGVRFRKDDVERLAGGAFGKESFNSEAVIAENARLKRENERLRGILREVYTTASAAILEQMEARKA